MLREPAGWLTYFSGSGDTPAGGRPVWWVSVCGAQRRAGHRDGLCVGDDVERIEDIAKIYQHRTCDGPETLPEVTDGDLFGVGAQGGSHRRDRLGVPRADGLAGSV